MIVDLNLSEEQRLIDDSIGGLLRQVLPIERLREPAGHGGAAERAAWSSLAESGLFGLGISEDAGGVGLGAAEEALAARHLGRQLASPALLAQMAAGHVADDPALIRDLASGAARAALALLIGDGRAQLIDAEGADHLLLIGDAGARIVTVIEREPATSIDDTLAIAHAAIDPAPTARRAADDRIGLLIAAYLTGIAQAAQAASVDYAKTREQFGQPIGAFQAIKHQCADMAVRSAAAEAQTFYAATIAGAGGDDGAEAAAALLLARRAALDNAKANIQVHGAMGFTAESDAHLFLKRAHVIAAIGDGPAAERARLLG